MVVVVQLRIVSRLYSGVPTIRLMRLWVRRLVRREKYSTPEPGQAWSTPSRNSTMRITCLPVNGAFRKIASEWYVLGFWPNPAGALSMTLRIWRCERTTTRSGTPNRRSSMRSISVSNDSRGAPDSNSTLPDWMWVLTASNPWASNSFRKSAIATLLRPPTLIPRSKPTYRVVPIPPTVTAQAVRAPGGSAFRSSPSCRGVVLACWRP